MEQLAVIREKLAQYPNILAESDENSITVHPTDADGFSVTFYACKPEFVVSLGGWHDHFDDASDALDIFLIALTSHARIDVTVRGTTECKWTLETLQNGSWEPHSTCGLLFFPFWRRKVKKHQQNNIAPFADKLNG